MGKLFLEQDKQEFASLDILCTSKVMLGWRSLWPGGCPCGLSLCADDKRLPGLSCCVQMAASCLSEPSPTFPHRYRSLLWVSRLSSAAPLSCLPESRHSFISPSSHAVYPARLCSASSSCNCGWVNIYRVQWGRHLRGSDGYCFIARTARRTKQTFVPLRWCAL